MKSKEFVENSIKYIGEYEGIQEVVPINDVYWAMKLAVIEELEALAENVIEDSNIKIFIEQRLKLLKKEKLRDYPYNKNQLEL